MLNIINRWVPRRDGQPFEISVSGDELSYERMKHAKRVRVRAREPVNRLVGLVETPQEFHKEGILMQVHVI